MTGRDFFCIFFLTRDIVFAILHKICELFAIWGERMKRYSTEQRGMLLEFFKANCDRQYSVTEIAEQLRPHNISTSAIYRNISSMVAEGSLRKLSADGSRCFLYQYIDSDACSRHIHLKCEGCGQVFHMDKESMSKITEATANNSGFSIDVKRTILYGLCKECNYGLLKNRDFQ